MLGDTVGATLGPEPEHDARVEEAKYATVRLRSDAIVSVRGSLGLDDNAADEAITLAGHGRRLNVGPDSAR